MNLNRVIRNGEALRFNYEVSGNEQVTPGKDGNRGEVRFQYLLTPERIGTVFVQPIALTYFDPATARFQTVRSESLTWNAKSAGPQKMARPVVTNGATEPVLERTFQPIVTERTLTGGATSSITDEPWFSYAVASPLALFLALQLLLLVRRFSASDLGKSKRRRAATNAQKRLLQVEGRIGQASTAEMYGEIAAALHGYLQDKHDVITAGSARHRLNTVLGTLGYDSDLVVLLMNELEACDAMRFAPSAAGSTEFKAALARARELIGRMEGQK